MTAWRRLRDWTEAGVWPRLHAELLAELGKTGLLERDDCAIDGSHVRALKGALVGPSPVDRARPGSKHHLIVDRRGTALAVSLTGGNGHDVTQLMPLLDPIPRTRGLRGRPRSKPKRLFADRGYDYDMYRRLLWQPGIKPLSARRGVAHGSGLGKTRWAVERTFAWLHQFKRLRIRYERSADLHQSLLVRLQHHLPPTTPHVILKRSGSEVRTSRRFNSGRRQLIGLSQPAGRPRTVGPRGDRGRPPVPL